MPIAYFLSRSLRRFKGKLVAARQRGTLGDANIFRFSAALAVFLAIISAQPPRPGHLLSGTPQPVVIPSAPAVRVVEPPRPTLLAQAELAPELTAKAVLAVEATSSAVLYEKDSRLPLPPASLTKLMTALLSLERYDLDEVAAVPEECYGLLGNQMGLFVDETITVENLLKGLLLNSASDAACTLATLGQTREEFIAQMNQRGLQLGMAGTIFYNPIGLDGEGDPHYSTAEDLMKLIPEVMKYGKIREIVRTPEAVVYSTDREFAHYLENTNEMLTTFSGTIGIKTGTTGDALECLIIAYERDGYLVYVVMLGSEDRYAEMPVLLDWIFASHHWPESPSTKNYGG